MGSLRSLKHSPLAKKNQPKKPSYTWRGLLAKNLRSEVKKVYPSLVLEVKPNYRKTSSVYVNWTFPVTGPWENSINVVNTIVHITLEFLHGKSFQKPVEVIIQPFDNNSLVIQEKV
jgi:hypothetical protein